MWMTLTIWGTAGCTPVGELLENHYRIGLVRMERAIKERMSLQEIETLVLYDLVNSKLVSAVVKDFSAQASSPSSWIKPTPY